jgi:hypothetical protein
MAFHDLTPDLSAPPAAKCLLGLGSRFIITPEKTTGSISNTLERFCRDFYIKIIFAGGDDEDLNLSFADHDKEQRSKLYVKSKWNPTESDVPFWASQRYSRFAVRLQRLFRQRKAKSNLLQFQQEFLEQLSENP